MNNNSGLAGLIVALVNRRRTNKALRQIEEANIENRGIIQYQPSVIEAFFDENEPINNMVFSGGLNIIRCRAIARTIECAVYQGFHPVVIHASNYGLEQELVSIFGSQYVTVANKGNPIYDPFYKKTNADIDRLVLTSGTKGAEVNATGRYYLDGISDFIRAKKITPYIDMYITCPHIDLLDKVNTLEAQGKISSAEARRITSEIIQGEMERGNIENFFSRLSMQAAGILADKSQLLYAANVKLSAERKQILAIDINSTTSSIFINMIANEIEMELEAGRRIAVFLDGIPIQSSESMQNLIKKSGGNCCITMSSDDVYADFNGDDNGFYSYMGKCSKVILSKHSSAHSCQKWSDFIGSYDKHEITTTFAENANYVGQWGMGATQTANVNVKRENIIKSEDLLRLNPNEVFVQNKNSGEISYTTVV